jgi:DNA-binding transcriptional regulator GbsR (MarR family)
MTKTLFDFDGPEYVPKLDQERLSGQLLRIYDLMMDGEWRTLSEIADVTKDHEASISAQLRHLRKERFGSHVVQKRRRGDRSKGLFEYHLEAVQ